MISFLKDIEIDKRNCFYLRSTQYECYAATEGHHPSTQLGSLLPLQQRRCDLAGAYVTVPSRVRHDL